MQILTRLNKVIAYDEHEYTPVGNSAICTASGKRYDNALITTVDCVPTDIDSYHYYYVDGKFIKGDSKAPPVLWDGSTMNGSFGAKVGEYISFDPGHYTMFMVYVNTGLSVAPVLCTLHTSSIVMPKIIGLGLASSQYVKVVLDDSHNNRFLVSEAKSSTSTTFGGGATDVGVTKIVGIC